MKSYEVLRNIQKTIKKELNNLRIKIYYSQITMDLDNLFKLMELYDTKKKQLILIKCIRQYPRKEVYNE